MRGRTGKGRGRGKPSMNKSDMSLGGISTETIVICVLLVVLLCLVIYYVRQNSEGFQNEHCTVYAFVADWCPNCKTAKPAINNLKNNAPSNVSVEVVNEKDDNSKDLMKKFGVRGFPTIILIKADGTTVEFNQRVNDDNLNLFVANNANANTNNNVEAEVEVNANNGNANRRNGNNGNGNANVLNNGNGNANVLNNGNGNTNRRNGNGNGNANRRNGNGNGNAN